MRRSLWWFLLYGASVLGTYAYGGLKGAWRMNLRALSSDSGSGSGGYGGGHGGGYGGGFRGGK
jgi:hypothetical protein